MVKTLLLVAAMLVAAVGSQQQAVADESGPDDLGIAGFAQPACQPVYAEQAAMAGTATGDPEKDTYALTIVGEVCP